MPAPSCLQDGAFSHYRTRAIVGKVLIWLGCVIFVKGILRVWGGIDLSITVNLHAQCKVWTTLHFCGACLQLSGYHLHKVVGQNVKCINLVWRLVNKMARIV